MSNIILIFRHKFQTSRAFKELIIWALLTVVLSVFLVHGDTLEYLYLKSRQYEAFELDESLEIVFILGIGACVYSWRRYLDIKILASQLKRDTEFDLLTQLPNARLARQSVNQLISEADFNTQQLIMVVIDIDRFSEINYSYGRHIADQVLKHFASRLQNNVNKAGVVARINSDEFLVAMIIPNNLQSVELLLAKLQEVNNVPIIVANYVINIPFTMGVALCHRAQDHNDELIRNTYLALENAKANLNKDWVLYEPEMSHRRQYREMLSRQLLKAILSRELYVVYQPVWDNKAHCCKGFEALVRWNYQGKAVDPFLFVGIAEEYGLINQLGKYVLFRSLKEMKPVLNSSQYLAVNISGYQIQSDDFIKTLGQALQSVDFNPAQLELELTETTIINNFNSIVDNLRWAQKRGIGISIDDFGTGYSSLSRLNELRVEKLKIDRSFIINLTEGERAKNIVDAIVTLARKLEMQIVVEGVEDEKQLKVLEQLGCDLIQGYYFSKPKRLEELSSPFIA